MSKDLIEIPRFNFFIGDEVFLKGKIVGFDVDENKYVENVVRLEYGQTLNVPNINIYTKNDITDKSKIKVKVPQFVADWLSNLKSGLFGLNYDSVSSEIYDWVYATEDNLRKLHLAFVYGYEVEKEKRYFVKIRATKHYFARDGKGKIFFSLAYKGSFTKKELEEAGFGWVFDCPGIKIEEVK